MAANPIHPDRPSPAPPARILMLDCPTCGKKTPHRSVGVKPNPALDGQPSQAMECLVKGCGTLIDVATGPDGRDFQANLDADEGASSEEE